MIAARLIALAIAYLIGSFQTGYFYGKGEGIDIREHGSGNAGTTNTLRVLGKKAGFVTLLGDVMKSVIAMTITYFIYRGQYPEEIHLLMLYAGFGVILGHNYPFYMGFRGGKGIACTVGIAFMLTLPAVPLCALTFFGILFFTRYVSLGSIVTYSVLYIQILILGFMGKLGVPQNLVPEFFVIFGIMTFMAIWRHRANIKRLMAGKENKFSLSKK